MRIELSGHKEKGDHAKKGQHAQKKSDHGGAKTAKEAGQAKQLAYFMSMQKKAGVKQKPIADCLLKEHPSLNTHKKSHGATEQREKSKESTKSKDFGKLLKKVTNSL